MVTHLEPLIQEKVLKLRRRLQAFRGTGAAVDLRLTYMCLATDVVSEYAMARSYNFLDDPGFAAKSREVTVKQTRVGHLARHFPWMIPLMRMLPDLLVSRLNPGMLALNLYQRVYRPYFRGSLWDHKSLMSRVGSGSSIARDHEWER